jgi:hypothetical protein
MDPYLALTPVFVLGIIGLIRFIGCNQVFGLDETSLRVDPVGDLHGTAADQRVGLTWTYPSSSSVTGFRIAVAGGPFDMPASLDDSARSVDITGLTNGVLYTFSVIAELGSDASEPVTISLAPGVTSFVTGNPAIITEQNSYPGWQGIEIRVGANDIRVTQLGRIIATNNSGTHEIKIVSPATTPSGAPVAGIDQVSAIVTTVAQAGNVGTFAWAVLPQPYTLQANTTYFIVSLEAGGGDLWYDEQPVPTTDVATLEYSIRVRLTDPDIGTYQRGQAGRAYGPVSFRY